MIETLYSAIQSNVPPETGVYLGREHLGEHDAPPRIVLVPRLEAFAPPVLPRGAGGVVRAQNRTVTVEAHLWGATFDDVDGSGKLLEQFIQALEIDPGRGKYALSGGVWLDQLDGWLREGRVLVVSLQLTVAVRAVPETLATITSVKGNVTLDLVPPLSIP